MTEYYDALTPYYKLIYGDWEKSITRQANNLHGVIREFFGSSANTILDVACGIGTQSIGLAKLGYTVTASDVSEEEIKQAKKEAEQHEVNIQFRVADMRSAWATYQTQFDIVLACDNAIPHLLSQEEILAAFQQFYRCVKPAGGCIVSVRDYADLEKREGEIRIIPRQVHQAPNGKVIVFDTWHFFGSFYDMTTYIIQDDCEKGIKVDVSRGGIYFCIEIPVLESLFRTAGFKDVSVLSDRFFQPLIVARKDPGG